MASVVPELVSTAMDKTLVTKTQLYVSSLYALNKSFSKTIFMGQEVGESGLPEISVRLIGVDYLGMSFNDANWTSFVQGFQFIEKCFEASSSTKQMLDQKIVGPGFSVRFIISHREKAVEIEEEMQNASKPTSLRKRILFRRCVVMKEKTFRETVNLMPLIEAKMTYFRKNAVSFTLVWMKICKKSREI